MRSRRCRGLVAPPFEPRDEPVPVTLGTEQGSLAATPGRIGKKASEADAFPLQADLPAVSRDGGLVEAGGSQAGMW